MPLIYIWGSSSDELGIVKYSFIDITANLSRIISCLEVKELHLLYIHIYIFCVVVS